MTQPVTMQEWKSFIKEAEENTDSKAKIARVDVVNQSRNGMQVAFIQAAFKNKENDVVRYEENVGFCTDPAAVFGDETKKEANEELKQLAEDTRHKRKQIKEELEELGFEIKEGLYA